MEREYSNEVKGRVHAYRFTDLEKKAIAEGLKPLIKKIGNKIEKVRNHPKNEGQVTYQVKIEELLQEQYDLQEIIKEFNG